MTTELAEFVRTRHAALVRRAYLLVGDQQSAEDLVQEALTRTCAAARRRRVGDLEAYTRRVMLNAVISGRRRGRPPERPLGDLEVQAPPGPDRALQEEMWRVLQTLSPQQRSVLVLRYYEGLGEAEIAEALNVTVGTVRQHAARGLRHLRQLIPTGTNEEEPSRGEPSREEH